MSEDLKRALVASWTDFLDANPDDLTSPEDLPDHALMTGDQFVQCATAAFEAARPSPTGEKVEAILCDQMEEWARKVDNDGTPAQVGPTPNELRAAATTIAALVAERDEARERLDTARATIVAGQKAYDDMVNMAADWKVRAEAAETALAAANARVEMLTEALEPSGDTKAAYSGEFYERVEIPNPMYEDNEDDEPETIMQYVPVSWITIKQIMAAIATRAALTGGENA